MHGAQTQFSAATLWRGHRRPRCGGADGGDDYAQLGPSASSNPACPSTPYLMLQGDARVMRTVDLPALSSDEARAQDKELVARRSTLNQAAPVPAFLAYILGRRNISMQRQTYEIDEQRMA